MRRDERDPGQTTRLLRKWHDGDEKALSDLMSLVYAELHRLAAVQLRGERRDHTLQPTALIHEAFLRLVDLDLSWQDRTHFLSMSARVMRRVLVDHARRRRAGKRHGGMRVCMDEVKLAVEPRYDLLALDEALGRLQEHEERTGRVVELFYFGGLTHEEIAEAEQISRTTVDRDLRFGRAWLRQELEPP